MIFQRIATVMTIVVVAGGVAAGFAAMGPPSRARTIALDQRRVEDLIDIAGRVRDRGGPLPVFFTTDPGIPRDPVTGMPYVYVKETAVRYRLCATFAAAAGADGPIPRWRHPAGPACFRFERDGIAPTGAAFAPPSTEIR